jgi:DNA-binding LytR/AlgR family response regulator
MAASLLAAVPIALLSHALAVHLWPGPVRAVPALLWYVQTLAVSGMLTLVHVGLPSARSAEPPAVGAAGDFRARLPPHLGRDVLALQMEDHYVRAHTRHGSALILIPLHQAIRELGGVPGLRIHRSWWVARAAVAGAVQQGRGVRLRLSNGMEAPVARAAVAQVRAAGWLG